MTDDQLRMFIQRTLAQYPDLFDDLDIAAEGSFRRWWPKNVHIIREFGKQARKLKEQGKREYYSAYCIREKIRWDSLFREIDSDYKISNNHTPFIARLIMKMYKPLDGMFQVKSHA